MKSTSHYRGQWERGSVEVTINGRPEGGGVTAEVFFSFVAPVMDPHGEMPQIPESATESVYSASGAEVTEVLDKCRVWLSRHCGKMLTDLTLA